MLLFVSFIVLFRFVPVHLVASSLYCGRRLRLQFAGLRIKRRIQYTIMSLLLLDILRSNQVADICVAWDNPLN